MNPAPSPTHARWRRTAVATLLGSPLALVSVLYARWADFRYVDIPLGNCLDSPGLPLAARLAACGGGALGIAVVILITVLLRSATRGPRPVESLLTPVLKAMLFVSLVFLLVEVYDLSELLGHFHPVHPRRDCDL